MAIVRFWQRLNWWPKMCAGVIATAALATLLHTTIGVGYTWGMVCEPRTRLMVSTAVDPVNDAAAYIQFLLVELVPDSVSERARAKYLNWKLYELRKAQ